MAVTLRIGKELQEREEVEKKKNEGETEKEDYNSVGYEKKKNKIGLSNKNEQMKEQDEVAKEDKLQNEEVRDYQAPFPFPQRL